MTKDPFTTATASSPTAHLLNEIALYGVRPFSGERDYRPFPEVEAVEAGIAGVVDATVTISSIHVEELLWSVANIFHRRLTHTQITARRQ